MNNPSPPLSRRNFLLRGGAGFGSLALTWMLRDNPLFAAAADSPATALLPHAPHFPPKAKNVIFLFMEGGPSHLDMFDPKPKLNELAGKPLPPGFGKVITAMGESGSPRSNANAPGSNSVKAASGFRTGFRTFPNAWMTWP